MAPDDYIITSLPDRGDLGVATGPLFTQDGQKPKFPGIHQRSPARRIADDVDMPAQQSRIIFGVPLVGHVDELDSGDRRQLFHGQVHGDSDPGGAVGQLPGVFLGLLEQVLQRFPWSISSHYDAEEVVAPADEGREIIDRVEVELAHMISHGDAAGDKADGIAVGRLAGD